MKKLTLRTVIISISVIGAIFLAGCDPDYQETTEVSDLFIIPEGLNDCKTYKMVQKNGTMIYAMRCPLSSTTVNTVSKFPQRVTIVESAVNQIPTNSSPVPESVINKDTLDSDYTSRNFNNNKIQINGETYQKIQN